MSGNTRIILMVIATVIASMTIALAGWYFLKGNPPVILMVIATVISGMTIALAGLYVMNKAVQD